MPSAREPAAREPVPPGQRDSAERLVVFTDAVAAIALTLLVLPLSEMVPEASRDGADLATMLREHVSQFGAFLLSFAVIFRFWWAHHRLFRHISALSRGIVLWSTLWMFSIVFLPVPTAIITAFHPSAGTVLLYTGTLVLTSGSLTALSVLAYRHPELGAGRTPETRVEVLGMAAAFGAQVIAMVVGTVFASSINYWALLTMVLTGPFERIVKARWKRQAAAQPALS